jgi:Uroporphyrinogen decarboxylase (URO-D)
MVAEITPRRAIKAILKGENPSRPLLMPILFSLGSRLENVTLRDFLSNPTKIVNALRQIRSVLKVDGLACYFDPFLEAEALGCQLKWSPDGPSGLACPHFSDIEELRQKLHSLDEVPSGGRVPVALQVLERLKVMLKDEPALMVTVTGPLTLAAQLSAGTPGEVNGPQPELVEFAAQVTACMSRTFVEAGADVVLIVERGRLELSAEVCESWASLLDPIVNVIRFYEALPVLLLDGSTLAEDFRSAVFSRHWNGVLCPVSSDHQFKGDFVRPSEGRPVALPVGFFCPGREGAKITLEAALQFIRAQNPIFLTSSSDIPESIDAKHLAEVLDSMRNLFSHVARSRGESPTGGS